jgi:alpha-galactosidase
MEVTDAMVSSGMKDAGYEYINFDAGWQDDPSINTGGIPLYNNKKFPHGMKYIGDYIHSKGSIAGPCLVC